VLVGTDVVSVMAAYAAITLTTAFDFIDAGRNHEDQ